MLDIQHVQLMAKLVLVAQQQALTTLSKQVLWALVADANS